MYGNVERVHAQFRTSIFVQQVLGLCSMMVVPARLSIQDLEPQSIVIGVLLSNFSILLTSGFLAQPNPELRAWKALSPLQMSITGQLFSLPNTCKKHKLPSLKTNQTYSFCVVRFSTECDITCLYVDVTFICLIFEGLRN